MIVQIEVKDIKKAIDRFGENRVAKAVRMSINRAVQGMKTQISSEIRKKFKIAKQDLDRKIGVRHATNTNLRAEVKVTGEPISLVYFQPQIVRGGVKTFTARGSKNQRMPGLAQMKTRAKTGYMSVEILRGKRALLRRAFFVIGKGVVPLVVVRRSTGKLQKVAVITEASMFRQTMPTITRRVTERFEKEFSNQIKQLQRGRGEWLE